MMRSLTYKAFEDENPGKNATNKEVGKLWNIASLAQATTAVADAGRRVQEERAAQEK